MARPPRKNYAVSVTGPTYESMARRKEITGQAFNKQLEEACASEIRQGAAIIKGREPNAVPESESKDGPVHSPESSPENDSGPTGGNSDEHIRTGYIERREEGHGGDGKIGVDKDDSVGGDARARCEADGHGDSDCIADTREHERPVGLKSWSELSREISGWALANYGEPSQPWQLFLGMLEEIGEFEDSVESGSKLDSLGDQTIYALNLRNVLNAPFRPWAPPMLDPYCETVSLADVKLVDVSKVYRAASHSARAILKHSQGIRGFGDQERVNGVVKFLSIWWKWACCQTVVNRLPTMLEITNRVWGKVSLRNWKKNPVTGI